MNSLKNLMILAVLAAVGYGVYASLSRNNADPGPSLDAPKGRPVERETDADARRPVGAGGEPGSRRRREQSERLRFCRRRRCSAVRRAARPRARRAPRRDCRWPWRAPRPLQR